MSDKLTVLVLDDYSAVRESLANRFEDRGWHVLVAATPLEALDLLTQHKPNGAVIDIRLPGMSGNQFIRKIQNTHPALACVICTGSPAYHPPHDILASAQVSNNVFFKPVTDLGALEEALRKQIEICKKEEPHE